MPFDATPTIDNPLTFSPGKEGLRKLAYVLRHKELWPAGYRWDYACHGKCAMGISASIFKVGRYGHAHTGHMAKAFGLANAESEELFLGQEMGASANDIADAIVRYLATGHV